MREPLNRVPLKIPMKTTPGLPSRDSPRRHACDSARNRAFKPPEGPSGDKPLLLLSSSSSSSSSASASSAYYHLYYHYYHYYHCSYSSSSSSSFPSCFIGPESGAAGWLFHRHPVGSRRSNEPSEMKEIAHSSRLPLEGKSGHYQI